MQTYNEEGTVLVLTEVRAKKTLWLSHVVVNGPVNMNLASF